MVLAGDSRVKKSPTAFWSALGSLPSSLSRRLASALLLIVLVAISLLAISEQYTSVLRQESANYENAVAQAEVARNMIDSVHELRVQTIRLIESPVGADTQATRNKLTEIAVQIADATNAIPASNGEVYRLVSSSPEFARLDMHVWAVLDFSESPGSKGERLRVLAVNERLAGQARSIAAAIERQHQTARTNLERARGNWSNWVRILAAVTIAMALLIYYDVTRNILPPLSRMHDALRRLAHGDIDVKIEQFRLHELNQLASALETFRKQAMAQRDLALRDPSTGMPNRRAFMDWGEVRLARLADEGRNASVALIDVDRFKFVNDDYGHATGDRLVAAIGERLGSLLPEDAVIARIGGDEFALLFPLEESTHGSTAADAIVTAMRQPFDLGDCTIAVTISIGHASAIRFGELRKPAGRMLTGMLNEADLALYSAKEEGRNRAHAFEPALEQARERDRMIEHDLAHALERGELRMVYQPIVVASGKRSDEVEALVRWNHADLGEIMPAQFIPAAERSGLMLPLGRWIIEQSLRDLVGWPGVTLSLNLSPLQLQADDFVSHLVENCRVNGLSAQRVMLEVTESVSLERNSKAILALELLRTCGFRIALDDFGTGYSSLSVLKSFSFDRLKLDRSLISGLHDDRTSRAVFDAAVAMARQLGAEIVAEGISEFELVGPVVAAGCTHLQGYYFSEPIESAEVAKFYVAEPKNIARAA